MLAYYQANPIWLVAHIIHEPLLLSSSLFQLLVTSLLTLNAYYHTAFISYVKH